jgi:hypothetical protein
MSSAEAEFNRRDDGNIDARLGDEWPLFNEALADSISSLPPRGQDQAGPSTYWVDVALQGLENSLRTGTDRPFAAGNVTLLRVRDGMIEARFDFDEAEAGEFMSVEDFRAIIGEWRGQIVGSASSATNPAD